MRDRTLLFPSILLLLSATACDRSHSESDEAPANEQAEGKPGTPSPSEDEDEEDDLALEEDEGAKDENPVPPKSLTAEVMRGHFAEAENAREALVRANLDDAKKAMAWLAGHDLGVALPKELAPLQANMQAAAKEFGEATNLREAGIALATTLARCGHCHKSAGKGPEIATTPVPDTNDLPDHMRRHHWAVRQLWAGLVTASDERFQAGVDALQEAPLQGKVLAPNADNPEKIAALDKYVHDLGKQLKAAKTEADRTTAYGHLLATCATCHRLMGTGPQPIGSN